MLLAEDARLVGPKLCAGPWCGESGWTWLDQHEGMKKGGCGGGAGAGGELVRCGRDVGTWGIVPRTRSAGRGPHWYLSIPSNGPKPGSWLARGGGGASTVGATMGGLKNLEVPRRPSRWRRRAPPEPMDPPGAHTEPPNGGLVTGRPRAVGAVPWRNRRSLWVRQAAPFGIGLR